MNSQKIINTILLLLIVTTSAFSQVTSSKTTIVENVNASKAGLIHVLNKTGDTIILKSNTEIYRFSFLFHSQKESVLMDLGSKEARIPLHHFEVGRYTVVAYREDAVYPISLNRMEAIAKPTDAIADLEEDVLRASLSSTEQLKRGMPDRETFLATMAAKAEKSKAEKEQIGRFRREVEARAKKEQALALVREKELRARLKKRAEEKALSARSLVEADRLRAEKDRAEAKKKKTRNSLVIN